MDLQEVLEAHEYELRRVLPVSAGMLQPPASEDDLSKLRTAVYPRSVPAEVETLYRWHNGGGNTTPFDCRVFMSVDRLLDQGQFQTDMGWPRFWLPIFWGAGGDTTFIDAEGPKPTEPFLWERTKEGEPQFRYLSLISFFTTATTMLRSGVFADANNAEYPWVLDVDFEAAERIRRELNPVPDGIREYREFFPNVSWPQSWLDGVDLDKSAYLPTGLGSQTIAERIEQGTKGPVFGRVTGTLRRVQNTSYLYWFLVEDDTGRLYVEGEPDLSPFLMYVAANERAQIELRLDPSFTVTAPGERRPMGYTGPVARATRIWHYPVGWP